MLFLLLDPLLLVLAVYLLARQEVKLNYLKGLVLCLILSFLVQSAFSFIGFAALLIYAAFLPLALVVFCRLKWKIASLIVGIFLAAKVLLMITILLLFSR